MVEDAMNTDDPSGQDSAGELPDKVRFDYVKSSFFRVVKVDGVHGGITPRGDIHMATFTERRPIPQRVVHNIGDDGTVGDELEEERVERDAIVREVDVDLIMSPKLARSVAQWLSGKVDDLERLVRGREQGEGESDGDRTD